MSKEEDNKEEIIPTLDDIVRLAIDKFKSQELINIRTDGVVELEPYSPLDAAWDTVEELAAQGINASKLAMQLIESTTVTPHKILDFENLSYEAGETWDSFYFDISKIIVEAELNLNHPKIIEEYRQRNEKFENSSA